MTSQRPLWMNGAIVPFAAAQVSVMAHSLQRGSLVFDFGTFHRGSAGTLIFRLREHLERFLASAATIGLEVPWSLDALETATHEAIVASGLDAGYLRWSALFPSMEGDVVPASPRAAVAIAAYAPGDTTRPGTPPKVKPEAYRVAVFADVRKAGPEVFPCEAKVAASYLGPMLARRRALAAGHDEVVLLDREGDVAEAPTANVFAVIGGALHTPPLGRILAGITRASVLELARVEGIVVREERLELTTLAAADEAFLTASSHPIAPISTINGSSLRDPARPVTTRLRALLDAAQHGRDSRFFAWATPLRTSKK